MHRAAATDGLGAEVSAIVRRHLERALADRLPAGIVGAGQKGGNLPGVLSYGFTARRDDGTTGSSVIILSRLPAQSYAEALDSGAPFLLAQRAVLDPATRDRLAAAL